MKLLCVNAGSSSLKFQLVEMPEEEVIISGYIEKIGADDSFWNTKVNGKKIKGEKPLKNHTEAVEVLIDELIKYGAVESMDEIAAVGHRVVHGGEKYADSVIIDDQVISDIESLTKFAKLHHPGNLAGIKAMKEALPNVPMVAVFDTAFHQSIPKERYIYPIPYEYYKKYGIRKYGAHGTSHEYVAYRVAEIMGKDIKDLKIVNCHLGQGASVCAIQNGKSVETSMGLTPLGGIPMGTRSGDLDPSVVTYLMKKENLTPQEMEDILNKKSGVYGMSRGVSVDFRDIENEALAGGTHAQMALDIYHYLTASYVAKCAVAMGGIDVLTFTAGVGEKGPISRKAICDQLQFFGVKIDDEKNKIRGEEVEISAEDSKVKVYVVPTNEELMIARGLRDVLSNP